MKAPRSRRLQAASGLSRPQVRILAHFEGLHESGPATRLTAERNFFRALNKNPKLVLNALEKWSPIDLFKRLRVIKEWSGTTAGDSIMLLGMAIGERAMKTPHLFAIIDINIFKHFSWPQLKLFAEGLHMGDRPMIKAFGNAIRVGGKAALFAQILEKNAGFFILGLTGSGYASAARIKAFADGLGQREYTTFLDNLPAAIIEEIEHMLPPPMSIPEK